MGKFIACTKNIVTEVFVTKYLNIKKTKESCFLQSFYAAFLFSSRQAEHIQHMATLMRSQTNIVFLKGHYLIFNQLLQYKTVITAKVFINEELLI